MGPIYQIEHDSMTFVQATLAKQAAGPLASTTVEQRNNALAAMAQALRTDADAIIGANARDMEAARAKGTAAGLLDRLLLDRERIESIASALEELVGLPDPLGEVVDGRVIAGGVQLTTVRVPLGVVAIVYEARPNVTADAAGLCLKTGNACILRGGSLASNTNYAMGTVLARAAEGAGLPEHCLQVMADESHEAVEQLMGLTGLIDLLIPRGGKGLIRSCVANSKVPVIQTGEGNCHLYLHEKADPEKALKILVNAKCQRVGVCNAIETLLIDDSVADELLPACLAALAEHQVTMHCDEHALRIARQQGTAGCVPADPEGADWETEYLAPEIAIKCVSGVDEAISHINRYGTGHSEAIVSEDYTACERFLAGVDAAAVYANASTRLTDGGVFGLGAEVGISTQKLHARGPMGLRALTTTKSLLRGTGQVRA